jgi:hypothetical protein
MIVGLPLLLLLLAFQAMASTVNTVGEWTPPKPATPATTAPVSAPAIMGVGSVTAKGVKIVTEKTPDVNEIMQKGILAIEVVLLAVAALFTLIVGIRCLMSQDCWTQRSMSTQRMSLSLSRQKAERAGVGKKHQ